MGTYSITEKLSHPTKFTCKVSFNGKGEEYHEVDSLDAAEIASSLQATADADEAQVASRKASEAAIESIEVKGGKIVV